MRDGTRGNALGMGRVLLAEPRRRPSLRIQDLYQVRGDWVPLHSECMA